MLPRSRQSPTRLPASAWLWHVQIQQLSRRGVHRGEPSGQLPAEVFLQGGQPLLDAVLLLAVPASHGLQGEAGQMLAAEPVDLSGRGGAQLVAERGLEPGWRCCAGAWAHPPQPRR